MISKERLYHVIKKPILTEKTTVLGAEKPVYVFEVDLKATKEEVKKAVEEIFGVNVEEVRTLIVRGKVKRVGRIFGKRSNWKKAYVRLKDGQSINFVEGL